ncbi:Sodium/hydrogen exchanger 9B2 [Cichlidogyrus casuarinus]|uniref:Sodium/hydrogen exchanger 9B2 n=1 Tax=Cichlidogyrus casuarinus TaxID=1844966 RepID=A0ABD2QFC9_9PLAT
MLLSAGMLLSGLVIRLVGTLILGEEYYIYQSPGLNNTALLLGEKVTDSKIRFASMCTADATLSALLRRLALATILTRAGFSLDPHALREGCSAVFRLALMPCFAETLAATLASKMIIRWDWSWGVLLGYVCGSSNHIGLHIAQPFQLSSKFDHQLCKTPLRANLIQVYFS